MKSEQRLCKTYFGEEDKYSESRLKDYKNLTEAYVLQGGSPGFKPHYPQIFTKRFCRTLATFEECPIEGTSFTVHYTVFRGYLQCDRVL